MDPERLRIAFEPDPDELTLSLFVQGTNLADWERFLRWVGSTDRRVTYLRGDEESSLPADLSPLFWDEERDHLLRIEFQGHTLLSFFFTEEEIELDIDSGAVQTAEQGQAILEFMREMGRALGKDVLQTHGDPPPVFFRYGAATDQIHWEYTEPTEPELGCSLVLVLLATACLVSALT